MKDLKLSDFKRNIDNPFIVNDKGQLSLELDIGTKRIYAGTSRDILVNQDTGEVKGHTAIMKMQEIDKETFVKVYLSEVTNLFGLSRKAIKVFSYVMTVTKPNKDIIYFDFDDCMTFTGYKARSVITHGLTELLKYSFLAKSKRQHFYYINPTIFFNGDRVSFVKSYKISNIPKLKESD